jgi:hypothetical protein
MSAFVNLDLTVARRLIGMQATSDSLSRVSELVWHEVSDISRGSP